MLLLIRIRRMILLRLHVLRCRILMAMLLCVRSMYLLRPMIISL